MHRWLMLLLANYRGALLAVGVWLFYVGVSGFSVDAARAVLGAGLIAVAVRPYLTRVK